MMAFLRTRRFVPDYSRKLLALQDSSGKGWLQIVRCQQVINSSPFHTSELLHREGERLNFDILIAKARIKEDINKIVYNMFFKSEHPGAGACVT